VQRQPEHVAIERRQTIWLRGHHDQPGEEPHSFGSLPAFFADGSSVNWRHGAPES
jgi:hypothetical protein